MAAPVMLEGADPGIAKANYAKRLLLSEIGLPSFHHNTVLTEDCLMSAQHLRCRTLFNLGSSRYVFLVEIFPFLFGARF
ncbi:hypothetical protein WAI453_007605 [Rhynchosporium graminicola]